MGYRFFSRDGTNIREVARLSESFQWGGDKRVIASIRDTLKRRGIDARSPEGWKQIAVVFSGGYFWAALDDTSQKDDSVAKRLEMVGRPDLAKRYKHLGGKHDQRTHGWRYAKGGSEADRLSAARRSMRGTSAEQRATYRKRAGMPKPTSAQGKVRGNGLRGGQPNTLLAARETARRAQSGDKLAEIELLGFGKNTIAQLVNEETHRGTMLGEYLRRSRARGLSDEETVD